MVICGDIPGGQEGRPPVAAVLRLRLQMRFSRVDLSVQEQRKARRLD